MSNLLKAFLINFGLWLFAQAVAWFYGGKGAAAYVAGFGAILGIITFGSTLITLEDTK